MRTFRNEKMAEAIKKVICAKAARSKSLIPGAMITINKVELSKDLLEAKILFSVFGCDLTPIEAEALMKEHRNEFRYEISQELNFRRTPKIDFCFDKNTEYAMRINKLLAAKADDSEE